MSSNRRSRRARGGFWATLVPLALAMPACTPDPIVIPVRNLERPADMGFVCAQKLVPDGGAPYLTARPMNKCHDPEPIDGDGKPNLAGFDTRATPRPLVRGWQLPVNQEIRFSTYGLVSNTARGEVAVVDFSYDHLVDLARSTPGYNQVPVGALPEAISVSSDGCQAVTANGGSCDLSVLDTSQLVASTFALPAVTAGMQLPIAKGLRIKGDTAELRAQPREIAFLPKAAVEDGNCATGTQPGVPAQPGMPGQPGIGPPGEVVVTFPHCGLIAVIHLPEGKITSSVRVLGDGSVVNAGTDPVCPVECGGGSARDAGAPPLPTSPDADADGDAGSDSDAADGGAALPGATADGGAPLDLGPGNPALPPPAARGIIAGLAIRPDATKLYVGLANAPTVVSVGLVVADPATGSHQLVPLAAAGRLGLAEGAVGVSKVRLSVDPFATSTGGRFVGDRGQFLYAFARDGSVRVLDVGPGVPGTGRECDVNFDLAALPGGRETGCVAVDDPHARKLFAEGPGLRLPRLRPAVAAPVPIDIAFAEAEKLATGYLLTSTGQVMHVGLGVAAFDFTTFKVLKPTDRTITHNFRRAPLGFTRTSGESPIVDLEPTRNFSSNFSQTELPPFASKVAFASPLEGVRVEGFLSGLETTSTQQKVWAYFAQLKSEAVPPEDVTVEWQGLLPDGQRGTGRLQPAQNPRSVVALEDVGADFCRLGARVGDIVALRGCEIDLHCDALRDQVCYRAAPGAPGVCVPRAFTTNEALLRTCRAEFASRRRYEIKEARGQRLELGLKLDEVPLLAVAPCRPDRPAADGPDPACQPDPGHKGDPRVPGDVGFSCQALQAGGPRCVKTCGVRGDDNVVRPSDALCRPGHVCADVGEAVGPLCVEAPTPHPDCFTGEVTYRVQAGRSYVLHSGSLPDFATQRPKSPGGVCEAIPGLDPRLIDRVSLDAPACAVAPGGKDLGQFVRETPLVPGNPCLFLDPNRDDRINTNLRWKALVESPDMRLVLTNFDTYVGDVASILISVNGGFVPLRALPTRSGADVALGVRIMTAPMQADPASGSETFPVPPYLFVIDQGRTLSDLSRGQLLRLNPRRWSTYEGGFFDSLSTNSFYPIQ